MGPNWEEEKRQRGICLFVCVWGGWWLEGRVSCGGCDGALMGERGEKLCLEEEGEDCGEW